MLNSHLIKLMFLLQQSLLKLLKIMLQSNLKTQQLKQFNKAEDTVLEIQHLLVHYSLLKVNIQTSLFQVQTSQQIEQFLLQVIMLQKLSLLLKNQKSTQQLLCLTLTQTLLFQHLTLTKAQFQQLKHSTHHQSQVVHLTLTQLKLVLNLKVLKNLMLMDKTFLQQILLTL